MREKVLEVLGASVCTANAQRMKPTHFAPMPAPSLYLEGQGDFVSWLITL